MAEKTKSRTPPRTAPTRKDATQHALNTVQPPVPDSLIESCRRGNCVLFAGGGLSAHAGLPTWDQLLSGLLVYARGGGIIDADHAATLESALEEGARDAAADGLSQAFRNQRDLLQNYLHQLFSHGTPISSAHQFLAKTPFSAIVTTSYDNLIETAFPEFAQSGVFTPSQAESLLDALSQKRRFILKLYGAIDQAETLTFSPIEYREVVSSNVSFSKFMEGFFFSRNFLFIGLSLESIQGFLSSFAFRGTTPHFALVAVSGSGWKARSELLLRRYNIQVISFPASDGFPELDAFARDLSLAAQPLISVPGSVVESVGMPTPGIRRVILEDIGSFEKLEIDFAKDHKWKILLGDNGVGKSTVLKAIAVAMIGGDARSYASRLVRAGKTRGRITLVTDKNPSGYITEILTKDMLSEADVVSIPSRPMEAEGWLALGFSPLRVVSWTPSTGPQPVVQKGRPSADDLVPLLSGEADPRMDRLKQWIVNLDAADKAGQVITLQELRTLRGHSARVSAVDLSADGRTLVSASIDKNVRVWDTVTGHEVRVINAHSSGVNALGLSGDGKTLVSGSYNGSVKVWDVSSGDNLRTLDNHSQVLSVAFSSSSDTIVAGSEDGSLGVWKGQSGKEVHRLRFKDSGEVWSVALTADGRTLVAGHENGSIRMWNLDTGRQERVFEEHGSPIWSVALSADGHRLVTGSRDGSVRVWEVATGSEIRTLDKLPVGVMSVALAADGRTVAASCADGTIKLWELDAARQMRAFRAHEGDIWSVALSSDGRTLASGGDDKIVKLWNVVSPEPTLSSFEAIRKFFDIIGELTSREDISFDRVTENFHVYVKAAGITGGIPIEILSQGLTSLFSWVGVLCQRLKETLQSPTSEPLPTQSYALVLIDELDAHMHPRWQQVLVPRLKKVFPNVQFVACTHSPLIVGGLHKEEVTRFALENGRIRKVDFDPDMTLGRTDQILTGELFDLSTTLDPATQDMMVEYQELLGKSQHTIEEDVRVAKLEQDLQERIPSSPSTPLERRSRELLEVLQTTDLSPIDASDRNRVQEHMARLSKTMRGEEAP